MKQRIKVWWCSVVGHNIMGYYRYENKMFYYTCPRCKKQLQSKTLSGLKNAKKNM